MNNSRKDHLDKQQRGKAGSCRRSGSVVKHFKLKARLIGQLKVPNLLPNISTTTTTTTNFIENWKITNYITFPPANSL